MKLVRKIIYVLIVLFLFSALTKNILDYQKTLSFYQSFKNDYEKTKKQQQELKTKILKSKDPYEVEKTIRNKLNMVKDGEVAVMINIPTPTPAPPTPTPQPAYIQWLNLFFKK